MKLGRSLYDWCFRYVGSTRSAALIRILLAMLIWYRFFGGVRYSLSSEGIIWSILINVTSIGMLIGIYARTATFLTAMITLATFYYLWVWQGNSLWHHHHTYFIAISTLMLSLAPCGKSYSVDAWVAKRRAARQGLPAPREEGNLFALRLLAIQLAILYFFAFWDKMFIAGSNDIFYGFLNGSRLEQILLFHYYGSDFAVAPWMSVIASAAAITVAVLELILPLLLIPRLQKWLVIPGLGLHLAFYVLLPLQTYSLTCMVLYLALFDANVVHGYIDLLGPGRRGTTSRERRPASEPTDLTPEAA